MLRSLEGTQLSLYKDLGAQMQFTYSYLLLFYHYFLAFLDCYSKPQLICGREQKECFICN